MANKFSKISKQRISTIDPKLQSVLFKAIQVYDFTVLEGHRSNERQDELYSQGRTKLKAGQSKHNQMPSKAVDLAPFPIDWQNLDRFIHLAGIIIGIGHSMGITIRWGGNWDRDNQIMKEDQNFNDLPHFELVND